MKRELTVKRVKDSVRDFRPYLWYIFEGERPFYFNGFSGENYAIRFIEDFADKSGDEIKIKVEC